MARPGMEGRLAGEPPLGKTAMSTTERHKRYMARLRARAAAGKDNTTHNKPASGQDIQLEWKILVDDQEEGYISAYIEPFGLYVRQIDNMFFWYVLKDDDDDDDKDAIDVTEGEAPSLVAAMAAAEAAVAAFLS